MFCSTNCKQLDTLGSPGNAHKVDTIAIAFSVGQVVAEMGAIGRDGLTRIAQDTHIVPDNFFVSKAGPTMDARFFNERFLGAANGSDKESLAGYRIKVG